MNSACFSGGEGRANARVSLPTFPAVYASIVFHFESLVCFVSVVAVCGLACLASCPCWLVGIGRQKIEVLLAKRCFLSSEAAGGVGGVSL